MQRLLAQQPEPHLQVVERPAARDQELADRPPVVGSRTGRQRAVVRRRDPHGERSQNRTATEARRAAGEPDRVWRSAMSAMVASSFSNRPADARISGSSSP
jgi:hypothetical protein